MIHTDLENKMFWSLASCGMSMSARTMLILRSSMRRFHETLQQPVLLPFGNSMLCVYLPVPALAADLSFIEIQEWKTKFLQCYTELGHISKDGHHSADGGEISVLQLGLFDDCADERSGTRRPTCCYATCYPTRRLSLKMVADAKQLCVVLTRALCAATAVLLLSILCALCAVGTLETFGIFVTLDQFRSPPAARQEQENHSARLFVALRLAKYSKHLKYSKNMQINIRWGPQTRACTSVSAEGLLPSYIYLHTV